jgi:Rrf2 family protein
MNGRFQVALHILTLLHAENGKLLSSDYIAGSVNANPALVRKELSALRAAGLVSSKEGNNGGYTLSGPASAITLAQVYRVVCPNALLGKARNTPNPRCKVGQQITQHLSVLDEKLNKSLLQQLDNQSLEQFYQHFK